MSSSDSPTTEGEQTTDDTLRRRIVQAFGGLGVVSFAGAMLSPLKTLGIAAKGGEVKLTGQSLVLAQRYKPEGGDTTYDVGAAVTKDMLAAPDSTLVYPEGLTDTNSALIRLHRLPPDQITSPTKAEWTAAGYVAYSAICTHLGCTVDWDEEQPTATGRPTDHCHCHGSQFDPYEGAKVVHPPAQRPLPQIGIEIGKDDVVTLTSDFEAEVGP
ncbi:MAG: ubiquinol-cytochrome c reductase iron-sulfur subunit [Halanaeroarchaeum sp.]